MSQTSPSRSCTGGYAQFSHDWDKSKCRTCGASRCHAINRTYTALGPPGLRCRNASLYGSRFCRKHRGREKS